MIGITYYPPPEVIKQKMYSIDIGLKPTYYRAKMSWTVQWKRRFEKQLGDLPEQIQIAFRALVHEIQRGLLCRYP